MAENVTNELLLENMKAMRAELARVANDVSDVKADVRSVKAHMAAFLMAEAAQDGAIAALAVRVERIEKRLNLTDETVPGT